MKMNQEQLDRWSRVESLPLPSGVGSVEDGMCAGARIAYAMTGQVTDKLQCVSQVALRTLIAANDALPPEYRQRLGTVEIRDALLATTPADDRRLAFVVAEQARQSSLRAFGYAGVAGPAVDALRECRPIINRETAAAAAADAATCVTCAATWAAAVRASCAAADAATCAAADRAATCATAEHERRIADVRALLGLAPDC